MDRVAVDKTGTLTAGIPQLTTIRVLPGVRLSNDDLVALAAAAEEPSEHPLGRAVVAAARSSGTPVNAATDFTSTSGKGVSAKVGSVLVEVGSPAQLPEESHFSARPVVTELEGAGQTGAVVRVNDAAVGVLGLADRLRPDAASAVTGLHALMGAPPLLLTGDNPAAARRLASDVGIDEVRAGLLPADKVAAVQELEAAPFRARPVGTVAGRGRRRRTGGTGLADSEGADPGCFVETGSLLSAVRCWSRSRAPLPLRDR